MITTFIIAAITEDGFIAKNEKELSTKWTSREDLDRFIALTKEARVVVMGSKTFVTMAKPLKDRLNIVYSRTQKFDQSNDPERIVETTQLEPNVLLQKLEMRGYTQVAICGGSEIYTKFMKAGLIDQAYITIEPKKFGSGITLFSEPGLMETMQKWKIVSKNVLPTGTILIEYRK